jgi:Mn-containing catalase
MDIATEEFSHLEIVGATITMLLNGVNGELKNAVDESSLAPIMKGKGSRDDLIQEALTSPQFLVLSGGGPTVTDSNGHPWSGSFVNANGDLTVDLRSNIGAESRAKIVYEYLMQFTDDPHVKETLGFLMTREISHFQMFSAALATITPNFPPGILQGDPRYTHVYFNMSNGQTVRGPWNEGQGPWQDGGEWKHVEEPIEHVRSTRGLLDEDASTSGRTADEIEELDKQLSDERSSEIKSAAPVGAMQWSTYSGEELAAGSSKPKSSRKR